MPNHPSDIAGRAWLRVASTVVLVAIGFGFYYLVDGVVSRPWSVLVAAVLAVAVTTITQTVLRRRGGSR